MIIMGKKHVFLTSLFLIIIIVIFLLYPSCREYVQQKRIDTIAKKHEEEDLESVCCRSILPGQPPLRMIYRRLPHRRKVPHVLSKPETLSEGLHLAEKELPVVEASLGILPQFPSGILPPRRFLIFSAFSVASLYRWA